MFAQIDDFPRSGFVRGHFSPACDILCICGILARGHHLDRFFARS
jgi:hypothetical protein